MKLFGTDGIRGHVGSFLTAPIALQVGFAAGKVLKAQVLQQKEFRDRPVVLIGQDSRTSGNMLTSALAAGLTSAGLDVWNLELCPTPTVAYLTSHLDEAIAGVMVSASHNPPEDNGIKFFGADGTKFSKILQAQVELTLEESSSQLSPEVSSWGNYVERSSLVELYKHSLCNSISTNLEGITVVLDLAWGAATSVAPRVFANLGAKVICLHDQPLGDRINVNCGSTCLDPLRAAVQEHKADMGFAFDGDADRVLAVDDRGGVIDGDYILYLWGQHLLQAQRLPDSCLVTTVMANLGFEKAWQKLGGQMVRTAVGDQYVHAEMMKSGAMLGGEQSGHVLCRHYGVSGDGLLTAIHLAALAKENSPLSELMAHSFIPYPQLLKNVRVEDKFKRSHWQECEPIHQALERAISDLGDRGRVLVRASGTEPLVRVMVEAETLALAQHWTNHLTDTIQLHLVS